MEATLSPLDLFIPLIVTLVKQSGFDRRWNAWIAIGVYAVWTAVSLALGLRSFEGEVTFGVFIESLIAAATTGFVAYQLLWKQLPGDAEQRLENATSVAKGPESEPIIDDQPIDTGSNG